MALFSTVSSPSPALACSFSRSSLLLCLLILAYCFLLQCNPILKTLDQPRLSFFFKNPAKKNGILLLQIKGACLCQPISWSMAAMLRDSVVVVVVAVVRMCPRAILLAITMSKILRGFPFLPYMGMELCLADLWVAGAPLQDYNYK